MYSGSNGCEAVNCRATLTILRARMLKNYYYPYCSYTKLWLSALLNFLLTIKSSK